MSIGTIIEEENVNLATLAVELERATIANQTCGEQSLYVSEPGMFPFWVEIREGIRCILLHSYLEFVPDCEHTDRLELCDPHQPATLPAGLPRPLRRARGRARQLRLVGNYPVYYRDGLFRATSSACAACSRTA